MAWGSSKIFRQWLADNLNHAIAALNYGTDVPKAALYNNTITPAQDVTAANSAYNAGQWALAQEVIDSVGPGTNWAAGGRALSGMTAHFADTAGVVWYDAADTAGAGNVTIADAYGCLVYDDTLAAPVADQGMSYHYFGGVQAVTAGTFTIVWDTNGIFRYTL